MFIDRKLSIQENSMKNINILLQDAKDVLDDLNIPYGRIVSVTVNSRATGRWGRCTSIGNMCYKIEISNALLDDSVTWESALNTMIHELLHAYPGRMCHTGEWKKCAERVNKEYYPLYNIKRTNSAAELGVNLENQVASYRYTVSCTNCGAKSYFKKRTKVVQYLSEHDYNYAYCCAKCGSHNLAVTVLNQ